MAEVDNVADMTSPQGGGQDNQPQEVRPKKTRNRLPVSCEPCRVRRAKCDRERPYCSACSKRGEMEKCVYQTKGPKHGAKSEDGSGRIPVAETEDRLRHLESLITQALQANNNNWTPPQNGYAMQPTPLSSAQAPESSDPSPLSVIVADLQELRSLITGDGSAGPADAYEEPSTLFGATTTPSLEFILHQCLPDRPEVEAYLATYFRAPFIVIPVIHPVSFQRQLQEFWHSRPNVDPIWVGLLFAVLSLAAHVTSIATGNGINASERFTTAAAQCFSLGGYTRPKKHLIPGLMLLCQSQYMRRLDPSREVRMIIAMVSQLAFQSGLHREPSRNTPIFEAEMRRRLWFMIRHFEIQIASQFGVPSVIPYDSHDTQPPRHLFDEDLTEDMTTLPEARDISSETTTLTSFLIKSRLMTVFAEVYHHAMTLESPNTSSSQLADATMMRLDADVRREHSQIPARYTIRPTTDSYTDNEGLVLSRLTLEFLAQKTLCILHRKRMAESPSDNYSRKACIDAASKIVKETTDLIPQFGVGGQLHGKLWILTSTIVNDFLLASMILCLAVCTEDRHQASSSTSTTSNRRKPTSSNNSNTAATDADRTRRVLDLLSKSRLLCLDLTPRSRGAKRVGEAITLMFTRLQQNANVDPSLPYSTGNTLNGSGGGGMNGFGPATTQGYAAAAYLPTPTPSETVSQERSTSGGGGNYGETKLRHGQSQQGQAQTQTQGQGYDYAANIAAAAQAEPLPVPVPMSMNVGSTTSSQGIGMGMGMSSTTADQFVAQALYHASNAANAGHVGSAPTNAASSGNVGFGVGGAGAGTGIGTGMPEGMGEDAVTRFLMDPASEEGIDWTAFDQFISRDGWDFNSAPPGGASGVTGAVGTFS